MGSSNLFFHGFSCRAGLVLIQADADEEGAAEDVGTLYSVRRAPGNTGRERGGAPPGGQRYPLAIGYEMLQLDMARGLSY